MNDVDALTTMELQQGLDRDSGLHVLNVQTDRFFAGRQRSRCAGSGASRVTDDRRRRFGIRADRRRA